MLGKIIERVRKIGTKLSLHNGIPSYHNVFFLLKKARLRIGSRLVLYSGQRLPLKPPSSVIVFQRCLSQNLHNIENTQGWFSFTSLTFEFS